MCFDQPEWHLWYFTFGCCRVVYSQVCYFYWLYQSGSLSNVCSHILSKSISIGFILCGKRSSHKTKLTHREEDSWPNLWVFRSVWFGHYLIARNVKIIRKIWITVNFFWKMGRNVIILCLKQSKVLLLLFLEKRYSNSRRLLTLWLRISLANERLHGSSLITGALWASHSSFY